MLDDMIEGFSTLLITSALSERGEVIQLSKTERRQAKGIKPGKAEI